MSGSSPQWILALQLAVALTLRLATVRAQAPSAPPSNASTPPAALDARPRLLRFVQADYPPSAREQGTDATVLLALAIDADGHVTDVAIEQGAGAEFDAAAMAAARQFEFAPARQQGVPVGARIRYRYRFSLRAASPESRGPTAVLRGEVRDATNAPLAGASVVMRLGAAEPIEQLTTALGAFRFELATAGLAEVTVTAPGMREYHAEETLHPRDDVSVIYRVVPLPRVAASSAPSGSPSSTQPPSDEQGVTVRAARPPREVTRTTLDRDEVRLVPGAGGDALRSIQNLPGVARPPILAGDLIIRGSAPGDTAVFVDGTDLPLLYHFSGAASVIPTEMLDRIDFYPGNFSARFGRATGGIVDVGLRAPRTDHFRAVATLSTLDVSLFAEGPITPTLSVAVAARRSVIDAFINEAISLAGITGTSFVGAPVYWDYQAIVEWRPSPHVTLRLAVFGDDDTLSVQFPHPSDSMPLVAGRFNFATRFHIGQISLTHAIAPGTQQRVMLSIGWTNTEFSGTGAFEYHETTIPFDFRYELSHTLSPMLRLNTGVDYQGGPAHESFAIPRLDDADTSSAPHIAADIRTVRNSPTWYVEAEITPAHGVRIVPGVRVEYFSENYRAIAEPRVSARWEFLHDWTVKGGLGLYSQPPAYDQTTTAPNTQIPGQTIGNPQLAIQTSMHYALGLEHAFSRYITLAMEGFYKTIDGIPVAAAPFDLANHPPAPPYSSTGIGRVYGVDVLFRHRPSQHFFGWVAYTLMRSERRDTPGGAWYAFDYDQTHILTILGSCNIGWGITVGLRFRYVTGSPTTPNIGSFYNADTMIYTPIEGARNSIRSRDFNQLDLRIDKTFRFRWGSIGAFLEVLNVYNYQNQEGIQYNYNYTHYVPVTGLPIFPNIGLRGEI